MREMEGLKRKFSTDTDLLLLAMEKHFWRKGQVRRKDSCTTKKYFLIFKRGLIIFLIN